MVLEENINRMDETVNILICFVDNGFNVDWRRGERNHLSEQLIIPCNCLISLNKTNFAQYLHAVRVVVHRNFSKHYYEGRWRQIDDFNRMRSQQLLLSWSLLLSWRLHIDGFKLLKPVLHCGCLVETSLARGAFWLVLCRKLLTLMIKF